MELGASREFVADREGRLYLTANRGSYVDARGAFSARIRKEIDLSAMTRADDNRNQDDSYDPFGYPADSNPGSVPAGRVQETITVAVVAALVVAIIEP